MSNTQINSFNNVYGLSIHQMAYLQQFARMLRDGSSKMTVELWEHHVRKELELAGSRADVSLVADELMSKLA